MIWQRFLGEKKEIFAIFFNEKLFREQLCYFKDIDKSESIDYYQESVQEKIIKKYLTEIALLPL
jgi:hypothetical protein